VIIHHEGPHRPGTITYEGMEYFELGEPGQYGHGVFDVPEEVGLMMTKFPHWKAGDPAGEHAVVLKPPAPKPVEEDKKPRRSTKAKAEVEVEDESE